MGNIAPGINPVMALRRFGIDDLGLTPSDTTSIKRIQPAASFIPNSPFNTLDQVEQDDVLIINSKLQGDLTSFVSKTLNMQVVTAESVGVLASNSGTLNRLNLQAAIDKLALSSQKIKVIWHSDIYPMAPGLILHPEVVLAGNSEGMKGSPNVARFAVSDIDTTFLKFTSNNKFSGINIDYITRDLLTTNPGSIPVAAPTFMKDGAGLMEGVRIEKMCVIGASSFVDFTGCQDLKIEDIYGYPIHGALVKIKFCYDIPYLDHFHVNPGAGKFIRPLSGKSLPHSQQLMDWIQVNASPTYDFEAIDEINCNRFFAFSVKTAMKFVNSYGTVVQGNFDQVETMADVDMNNSNSNFKTMKFLGCSGFGSGGATPANRNGFVFRGTGGALMVLGMNVQLGDNEVLNNDNDYNANSFLKCVGTGPQDVTLVGVKGKSGGVFAQDVDKQNSQCVVRYFDTEIENANVRHLTGLSGTY